MKFTTLLLALLLPLSAFGAPTNMFDSVLIKNNLQLRIGTPGLGKFWLSDANGNGSWNTVSIGDVFRASNNVYNVGTTQYFAFAVSTNLFMPVGGIRGVTNGSNATAGNIGEYLSAQRIQASGISLANITHTTVLTLTLPAGDWDVGGLASFNPGAATTFRNLLGGFTTTTNGNPAASQFAYADQGYPAGYTLGGYATSIFVPSYRFVCTTTSNLYLNLFAEFATSTMTGYGFMTARRSANAK